MTRPVTPIPGDPAKKTDDPNRSLVAFRLRQAREYLGLSQAEVASHLQIPRSAVSHIESGRRRIDVLELKRLAELYRHSVAHFTGDIQVTTGLGHAVRHLARATEGLSPSDLEELNQFANYLRARNAIQTKPTD